MSSLRKRKVQLIEEERQKRRERDALDEELTDQQLADLELLYEEETSLPLQSQSEGAVFPKMRPSQSQCIPPRQVRRVLKPTHSQGVIRKDKQAESQANPQPTSDFLQPESQNLPPAPIRHLHSQILEQRLQGSTAANTIQKSHNTIGVLPSDKEPLPSAGQQPGRSQDSVPCLGASEEVEEEEMPRDFVRKIPVHPPRVPIYRREDDILDVVRDALSRNRGLSADAIFLKRRRPSRRALAANVNMRRVTSSFGSLALPRTFPNYVIPATADTIGADLNILYADIRRLCKMQPGAQFLSCLVKTTLSLCIPYADRKIITFRTTAGKNSLQSIPHHIPDTIRCFMVAVLEEAQTPAPTIADALGALHITLHNSVRDLRRKRHEHAAQPPAWVFGAGREQDLIESTEF